MDWQETRQEFKINNPRRLCKHIINNLNTNNLQSELKYCRKSLNYYQKKPKRFRKDVKELIYLIEADCKILYVKDDWINIYNKDGNKYGFLPL